MAAPLLHQKNICEKSQLGKEKIYRSLTTFLIRNPVTTPVPEQFWRIKKRKDI
jgi:hypothetical protein